MSGINVLQGELYNTKLENFGSVIGPISIPDIGGNFKKSEIPNLGQYVPYRFNTDLLREGSGIVYQQQRPATEKRGYLSRIGDRLKSVYEFVGKPYVGFGLLGGLLGGLSGLAFGPLGALFSAAVVGAMGFAFGTSLYWGWTRGERKPRNDKWLDGRSIGKYVADNWPRGQAQPTAQLSSQYA